MKLLGLMGVAGSGKSTAAAHLVAEHGFVELSMADPLKDLCSDAFGWDRERLVELGYKEEQDPDLPTGWTRRRVLQFVGTECFREIDPDHWVKAVLRKIDEVWAENENQPVVISDVRFPNEISLIHGNDGIIIRVERRDFESPAPAHASELAWRWAKPDYVMISEFGVPHVQASTDRMIKVMFPNG